MQLGPSSHENEVVSNTLTEELDGIPTTSNFATVQIEGICTVTRNIEYYNGSSEIVMCIFCTLQIQINR